MRSDDTASDDTYGVVRAGVLILSGRAIRLTVEHDALCVHDGLATKQVDARYHRAYCPFSRVAIIGHDGMVTLAALRWLHDTGISLVQIDRDGTVIVASALSGSNHPALRRRQALASSDTRGVEIMRWLLARKIDGQADVLEALDHDAASDVRRFVTTLETAGSLAALRLIEARAALRYWQPWESVPIPFARQDAAKVPQHWQTFGSRTSPLTHSPRRATTPGNALLNYLYALLECEARIACLAVGLDPGIGLLHTDQSFRDSLVFDVMEAARPKVDQWLHGWLGTTRFAARDFIVTRDGTVRLGANLTRQLAATGLQWSQAIGPFVEHVVQQLMGEATQMSTPLTKTNHKRGRERLRQAQLDEALITEPSEKTKPPMPPDAGKAARARTKPHACFECGKPLTSRRKFCSDACRNAYRQHVDGERIAAAGPAALAELRSNGVDPAHGGRAAAKRSTTQAARASARREWEALHGNGRTERERFVRDIQPKLVTLSLLQIVAATGFSLRYASLIRGGSVVPHPVHHAALAKLVCNDY